MNDILSPVGKPAPPRPRRPDSLTCSTIQSRPLRIRASVPSQSPRRRAAPSRQSCSPYRLVKMRSLSASIGILRLRQGAITDVVGRPALLLHLRGVLLDPPLRSRLLHRLLVGPAGGFFSVFLAVAVGILEQGRLAARGHRRLASGLRAKPGPLAAHQRFDDCPGAIVG